MSRSAKIFFGLYVIGCIVALVWSNVNQSSQSAIRQELAQTEVPRSITIDFGSV